MYNFSYELCKKFKNQKQIQYKLHVDIVMNYYAADAKTKFLFGQIIFRHLIPIEK